MSNWIHHCLTVEGTVEERDRFKAKEHHRLLNRTHPGNLYDDTKLPVHKRLAGMDQYHLLTKWSPMDIDGLVYRYKSRVRVTLYYESDHVEEMSLVSNGRNLMKSEGTGFGLNLDNDFGKLLWVYCGGATRAIEAICSSPACYKDADFRKVLLSKQNYSYDGYLNLAGMYPDEAELPVWIFADVPSHIVEFVRGANQFEDDYHSHQCAVALNLAIKYALKKKPAARTALFRDMMMSKNKDIRVAAPKFITLVKTEEKKLAVKRPKKVLTP